jgi:hypothetical protein
MYIVFTDKSEARWSPLSSLRVDNEFLEDGFKAFQCLSMFSLLEDGELYKFKMFLATLKIDKSDPLFVRMFIEDHFPGVQILGFDIPEIPFTKKTLGVNLD